MASNIIRMVLKLDDKASPELKQVGKEADKTTSKTTMLGKASKLSAGQIAMIGTAAIGVAMSLRAMAQSYADTINQFGDAATVTGASTLTLETLSHMAKGTNIQFGELTRGLADFNKNVGELKTKGTGALKDAFEAVEFDPTGLETTDEILVGFIETLQSYGDQQKVAFAANRAFGVSSKKMVAALDVGKFKEYNDQIKEMGQVATPEAVAQAQKMQKGFALMEVLTVRLKGEIFETFAGPQGMVGSLSVAWGVMKGMMAFFQNYIKGLQAIGQAWNAIAEGLEAVAEGDVSGIKKAGESLADAYGAMAKGLTPLNLGYAIAEGVDAYEDFAGTLGEVSESSGLAVEDLQGVVDVLDKMNEEGDDAGETGQKVSAAMKLMEKSAQSLTQANYQFLQSMMAIEGRDFEASMLTDAAALGLFAGRYGDLQEKLDAGVYTAEQVAQISRLREQIADVTDEAVGLVDPLTEIQSLLMGADADFMGGLGADYQKFAQMLDRGDFEGLEEQVKELQRLREIVAELSLVRSIFAEDEQTIQVALESEAAIRAMIEDLEKKLEAEQFKITTDADVRQFTGEGVTFGAGIAQQVAGGNIAGAGAGILEKLGKSPFAGAVVGSLGAIAEIGQMTVKEVKQNAEAFAENLANGIKVIAKALPQVIVILIRELPRAILEALYAFIPLLFSTLVNSVGQAFREWWEWRGSKGGEEQKQSNRSWLRNLARAEMFGARSFSSGSARVDRTGLALIHRNETIIPAGGRAAQDQQHRMGGASGITVNISTAVMDRDVIPRLVREIDRAVGKYGRTTAAFAGG